MSEIIDSLRADLEALHKIGAVDEAALHEFDAICQQQQRASKARMLHIWPVRIFLALLALDGVLLLFGARLGALVLIHMFAGFLLFSLASCFYGFQTGKEFCWQWSAERKIRYNTHVFPWFLFGVLNILVGGAFIFLEDYVQEPQPAPPALTCPAPAASAAPASAAAAQTN